MLGQSKPFQVLQCRFSTRVIRPYNPAFRKKLQLSPPPASQISDRTYRESLYSARRIVTPIDQVGHDSADWMTSLNRLMRHESISAEVRRRRQFVTPSKLRIQTLFKSRQARFNEMFKGTVNKIMNIYESQKK